MASTPRAEVRAESGTSSPGKVFDNLSFFILQRVPLRAAFIDKVHQHGGRVVKLETHADYIIADHMRRDSPPGSYSYTLIDQSISLGALANPDEHRADKNREPVRAVGSALPARGTRIAFTAEDDRFLWNWVETSKAQGYMIKGNEIYKQLEARNPRHTFQSWRDRYLKYLMDRPPAGIFHATDFEILLENAPDIENLDEADHAEAWENWAQNHPVHTADAWAKYYRDIVRPAYLKNRTAITQNATESELATHKRRRQSDTAPGSLSQSARTKAPRTDLRNGGNTSSQDEPTTPQAVTSQSQSRALTGNEAGHGSERHEDAERITSERALADDSRRREERDSIGRRVSSIDVNGQESLQSTDRYQINNGDQQDEGEEIDIASSNLHLDDLTDSVDASATWLDHPKDSLTKSNLANHQAQHQAQVLRGMDLQQDDPLHDQSEYLAYLQNIVGQRNDDPERLKTSVIDDDPHTPQLASNTNGSIHALALDSEVDLNQIHTSAPASSHLDAAREQVDDLALPDGNGQLQPHSIGNVGTTSLDRLAMVKETYDYFPSQSDDADYHVTPEDVDLTIAEPQGGFDLLSSPNHSYAQPSGQTLEMGNKSTVAAKNASQKPADFGDGTHRIPKGRVLETQDIINAETQPVDLDMPGPLEGIDDTQGLDVGLRSPADEATLGAKAPQREELSEADFAEWARKIKAAGHSQASLLEALKCTSMDPNLAEIVLREERMGRGRPRGVPGIWSDEEDRLLEGEDARDLEALDQKHGWAECRRRLRYLQQWRDS